MPESAYLTTPLHNIHCSEGATLVPFAGWEMPLQYPSGILAECRAVRAHAGIFDISHMGRIEITGEDAPDLMDHVSTQDILGLKPGRARYTLLCSEDGGIIDDAIIYRPESHRLLIVPNAANHDKVCAWLESWSQNFPKVALEDTTRSTAMIALQGPGSPDLLDSIEPGISALLRPFSSANITLAGIPIVIAKTGYTGEEGFEIIVGVDQATEVWMLLHKRGAFLCGLGARDILRLEAGLLLHGKDIDISTNPIEAGLERFVNLDKRDFVGSRALKTTTNKGVARKLIGFVLTGRGIPRSGCRILANGKEIGTVTSGSHSPTLDKSIGLGYVAIQYAHPNTSLEIDIRGRVVAAEVIPLPFYYRKRNP